MTPEGVPRFNEAVGYHRRNGPGDASRRTRAPTGFNEAVGYHRRNGRENGRWYNANKEERLQ